MWEAARFYFGKELRDLSVGEMAILAGMVKAPNLYAPTRHPDSAIQRRNYVLQRMREHGDLTQEEYNAALQETIPHRQLPVDVNEAPYFADFVRDELRQRYPSDALTTSGMQIFTALDMRLQKIAQEVVRKGVERLEAQYRRLRRTKPEDQLQACLIAMRPQTGEVLAMVGGRDYQTSQFNRVTQAHRQPGSVFKPIVYLTALAREHEHHEGLFLPTSLVLDAPFTWSFGDQEWSPGNYNDRYYGTVSLRRALEQSLNAATARVAQQVGLKAIRDTARQLGFVSPLPLYPSVVLGSAEVTPYEVAVAFSTLANQGVRVSPLSMKKIVNQEGQTVEQHFFQVEKVLPPEVVYMITHLMEGVIESGTAREARRMGFARPAAGKTGTTNDYGDAWFVGFTPELVTVVWVGFDRRESLHLSGGQAALPIWTEFMKHATAGEPVTCFSPPPGVYLRREGEFGESYDASPCPSVTEEAFYSIEEARQTPTPQRFDAPPVDTSALPAPQTAPETAIVHSPAPPASLPATPDGARERKPWWRLF
jgi:penicillin-binding protein 1B